MSNDNQVMLMLGRIEGQLKGVNDRLDAQGADIIGLRKDVCDLKVAGGRHGAVAGTVTAVGVSLIIESAKSALGIHGG